MIDPALVTAWEDQQRANVAASQPKVDTKKKKKNFWLDQISTVGGIGGGILGTLASPILGTAAGAGAGSALGEAIENAIMGEQDYTKNVLKEGAMGAVFGAGPIKLLKGAGAGAKALATGADDVVGVASRAATTPLRKKAGEKLVGAADDLAIKQFRLTPTQLKNFKGKFGEDAGKVIRKYGFQTADDVTAKGIQPLQQQFDTLIESIPSVNKQTLQKSLESRISTLLKSAPADTKALGKQLKSEADTLLKSFGDTIDAKELNLFRQQFDQLVNYTEKVSNPARYGVNKRMADAIRETLQTSDPSGTLKNVGRELQKLRQLSDNVMKQSELGRGSLPFGIGALPGAVMGVGAGGPAGAVGGYMLNTVANSPAGRRAVAGAADKVGSKLASTATGQSARGVATRVGGVGILNGMANQGSPLEEAMLSQSLSKNSMDSTSTNPMSSIDPMNANMIDSLSSNSQQMSNSPFAPDKLEDSIMQIMASGGTMKDVSEFLNVAKSVQALTGAGGSAKKLNATQIQQSNNAMSALNDISSIRQAISQDSSIGLKNSLPGGSFTRSLTGTSGYEAMRQNVADALGRLRSGGAINKDEEKRFLGLLPNAFDNQEIAGQKLARLEELFMSFAYPQSDAGSLEDAMLQLQTQGAY